MKSSIFVLALLVLMPSASALAKIKVVTTLPSFADIAQIVGGDEVDARSMTKGTQDPHFVDAKPDLILQLNKADLLIHAGLGLEDGWLPPLVVGSRNGRVQAGSDGNLNASTHIALKEVPKAALDRSMGDVHPGGNPHYMLDPHNGIVMAKALADTLSKLDPAKSDYFHKRAADYSTKLAAKIKEWEEALKPLAATKIVTYHKSWIYFSEWAKLNEVGYVEPKPGIPPAPDHIVKIINLMREQQAKLILMEPFYPKGAADSVARETGATLLVLPAEVHGIPEAENYIALFDTIIKKLKTH
jgi:zinc/manganese transport system substrate-binding protein